jgi:hypothetical protein
MLALSLSVCEFTDTERLPVSDSPTQLNFGPDEGAYFRGGVVGNLLVWFAFWNMVTVLAAVRLIQREEQVTLASLQVQARRLGLPGVMTVPFCILLQPTIASSILLLQKSHTVYDVVLGLVGVTMSVFCVAWLDVRTLKYFGCVAVPHVRLPEEAGRQIDGVFTDAHRWLMMCFTPRIEWVGLSTARPYYVECYSAVFEEYDRRRHWFFAVESGLAIAAGVIGGIRPQTEVGCVRLRWANLALSIAGALSIFLWAYRSPHGNFNYALNNAACLVCAVLLLMSSNEASDWIAISLSLFTVVSTLSGVFAVLLRLYRRWQHLLRATVGKMADCPMGTSGRFLQFLIRRVLHRRGRPLSFISDLDPELHRTCFQQLPIASVVDASPSTERRRDHRTFRAPPVVSAVESGEWVAMDERPTSLLKGVRCLAFEGGCVSQGPIPDAPRLLSDRRAHTEVLLAPLPPVQLAALVELICDSRNTRGPTAE